MGKITDYAAASEILGTDVFLLDGSGGTRKITAANLLAALAEVAPGERAQPGDERDGGAESGDSGRFVQGHSGRRLLDHQ